MSQLIEYIGGDFEGYYYTHQTSPLGASEKLPGGATHAVHIYRGKLENARKLADYEPSNYLNSNSLLLHNVNQIEANLAGVDRKIFDFGQAVLTDVQVLQSWELQGKTYGTIKGKLFGKVKEGTNSIASNQKSYNNSVQPSSSRYDRLTGWWNGLNRPSGGSDFVGGAGNSGCLRTFWDILKWLLLLLLLYLLFTRLEGCFGKSSVPKPMTTIIDSTCCKSKDSLLEENKKIRAELDSLKYLSEVQADSISKEEIQEQLDELSSKIYFCGNSTVVREFSVIQLAQIVELLNKYPNLQVEVRGYRNYAPQVPETTIDEDRAEEVKRILIQRGIDESRIDSKGMGVSNLDSYTRIDSIYDPKTNTICLYNINMRVEIKIVKY